MVAEVTQVCYLVSTTTMFLRLPLFFKLYEIKLMSKTSATVSFHFDVLGLVRELELT